MILGDKRHRYAADNRSISQKVSITASANNNVRLFDGVGTFSEGQQKHNREIPKREDLPDRSFPGNSLRANRPASGQTVTSSLAEIWRKDVSKRAMNTNIPASLGIQGHRVTSNTTPPPHTACPLSRAAGNSDLSYIYSNDTAKMCRTYGRESLPPGKSSVKATRRPNALRPLSAFYNEKTTNRLVEDRLRVMYARRRATSATPHLRRTMQFFSNNTSSSSGEGRIPKPTNQPILHKKFSNMAPLGKFRTIVSLVICVRRLMLAMADNCSSNTLRSASQLQWMTVYAEKHDATLAFNKHIFSRDRVSSHVPEWALSILGFRPDERTEQDCRRLHALLRGMRSFDKFTEEVQMFLCRAFTHERVDEGRVVLKSGHVGVKFYLIYTGSVFVNVEDSTRDGVRFMSTVAVLGRGESFGELALLQDIKRTATVSVRERCELLTVDKHVFASVCPRIFERQLAEKFAFLRSLDLFSSKYWTQESIQSLAMNAQIQEYKMNKVIVADSSSENWIYICMEGRCQIMRCLSLEHTLKERDSQRRMSEVVLSEEILQLLSSAVEQEISLAGTHREEDMKENLLTSLGLEYVPSGKQKLYKSNDQSKRLSQVTDTMTLTTFIKRYMENQLRDYVILSLGFLEAGQVFDLPSLLEESSSLEKTSTLMLVSSGARVLMVNKAAFLDQASSQALDNTRTLASKQRNPSDEAVLESYKCKVTWEEFKSKMVAEILRLRHLRYQPLYRALVKSADGRQNRLHVSSAQSSRIISALRRHNVNQTRQVVASWVSQEKGSCEEMENTLDEESDREFGTINHNKTSLTAFMDEYDHFKDIPSASPGEIIIVRRHLPSGRTCKKIARNKFLIDSNTIVSKSLLS